MSLVLEVGKDLHSPASSLTDLFTTSSLPPGLLTIECSPRWGAYYSPRVISPCVTAPCLRKFCVTSAGVVTWLSSDTRKVNPSFRGHSSGVEMLRVCREEASGPRPSAPWGQDQLWSEEPEATVPTPASWGRAVISPSRQTPCDFCLCLSTQHSREQSWDTHGCPRDKGVQPWVRRLHVLWAEKATQVSTDG